MASLTPISSKLAKLIPLLSSDKDGEVVAAARAMERMLRSAGLDLHALAEVVAGERKPISVARSNGRPNAPGSQEWHDLAIWCRDNDHFLAIREREFVQDMVSLLACSGSMTKRQAAWLQAIYLKLRKVASS